MVGDKPCFNFVNGSCRFGDRCHYSHDLSSASGTANTRHGHPARGGWQRGGAPFRGNGRELSDLSPAARDIIERKPTHQTFKRPNEQGFPDFNAVTMRSSDALLPPFKALPPRTVFGRVTGMSKDDKKINTPAVAEELLLLLNAGNNTNELWVSEPAWDVADEKTFEESQSLLTKCAEVSLWCGNVADVIGSRQLCPQVVRSDSMARCHGQRECQDQIVVPERLHGCHRGMSLSMPPTRIKD